MLLFKKKFLSAIRSGEKTQTIRLWKHCRMKAGQRSYIPGAGYIEVRSVAPVELDELSDADAVPDGFSNVAALRAEIATLYAAAPNDGRRAYRVLFRLLDPEQQAAAIAARKLHRATSRATAAGKGHEQQGSR